jgi:hypothetical protein
MPRARGPKQPASNVEILTREEQMFRQRLAGVPVRRIAAEHGCSVEEAQTIIAGLCTSVTAQGRLHSLELELERLDELQEVFHVKAKAGDPQCAAIVIRLQERRSALLGLDAPASYLNAVQLVNQTAPKESSVDKIMAALNRLSASNGGASSDTNGGTPQ